MAIQMFVSDDFNTNLVVVLGILEGELRVIYGEIHR